MSDINNEAISYLLMKLVGKEPEFEAFKQKPGHRNLKIELPYFAILDAEGNAKCSGAYYKTAKTMVGVLGLGLKFCWRFIINNIFQLNIQCLGGDK